MSKVLLIGDIHGRVKTDYLPLVQDPRCEPSVQLGDLDISKYSYLANVDSSRHKILPGNHDHYGYLNDHPQHFLKGWGVLEHGGLRFFYVRGANSIDKDYRVRGRDWWPEEELEMHELQAAIDFWHDLQSDRPEIILSHTAPTQVSEWLCRNNGFGPYRATRTERALQWIAEIGGAKFWYHGHHHKSATYDFNGCKFRCLASGEVLSVIQDGYTVVRGATH